MMKRQVCLGLALLFGCGLAAQSGEPEHVVTLIEPGSYHGNELQPRTDGAWLGLIRQGTRYTWQTLTVRVIKERDEIVDLDDGAKTGKRVEVLGGEDALFLLRGAPKMLGTLVKPVVTEERPLGAHDRVTIDIGAKRYTLSVTGIPADSTEFGRGSALELSDGTERQVLYSLPDGGDEPNWSVLWAGDMDGDGRLDLYLNLTHHYNVENHTLFLSSPARKGELLRRVAAVTKTGC